MEATFSKPKTSPALEGTVTAKVWGREHLVPNALVQLAEKRNDGFSTGLCLRYFQKSLLQTFCTSLLNDRSSVGPDNRKNSAVSQRKH